MTAYCGARRRQQPDADRIAYCRKPAGWGTSHVGASNCRLHLGNAHPQIVKAASLHAERSAARALAQLRSGPVIPESNVDPGQALRGMLHESAVLTGWLRMRVEQELGDRWIGDRMGVTTKGDLFEVSEEVRQLVKLYHEGIDRTAKLAKTCLDAGVDAAMVQLHEAQGARLAAAFRLYCTRMEFDPETAARSRREFAAAFRELRSQPVSAS